MSPAAADECGAPAPYPALQGGTCTRKGKHDRHFTRLPGGQLSWPNTAAEEEEKEVNSDDG